MRRNTAMTALAFDVTIALLFGAAALVGDDLADHPDAADRHQLGALT